MAKEKETKKSPAERLIDALGKEVLSTRPGKTAAEQAMKEVKEERAAAQVEKAKELYHKAISLFEMHEKQKRELEAKIKKNEKELGKAVSAIEALGRGGAPPEEEGDGKETTTESTAE